jgi:hypothetical protein
MKTARFASNAVVMPSLEFHPNTTIPGRRPEAAAMVEALHITWDFAIHIASTYHCNHSKIMLLGELGICAVQLRGNSPRPSAEAGLWKQPVAQPYTKWLYLLIILVLTTAAIFRLWVFAAGRTAWHDEILVALNLIHLPFAALFGPLHFDQMAPAGWLALEKLAYVLWPNIDYSLRMVSLVGGIAAVFLCWRLSRDLLRLPEAVLATALFGFSTTLIRYSAMIKPYILDALFSVAILIIAAQLITSEDRRRQKTIRLALLGAACVTLTFSSLFVLASSGLVLFAVALARRDWQWAAGLAGVGLAWAAMFIALYLSTYAGQAATVYNMVNVYWTDAFAPIPTTVQAVLWYPHKMFRVLGSFGENYPHPKWMALVLAAAALAGVIRLARRSIWLLALLVSPFAISLAASAARAYPFENRLQLSLAAPFFILVAHGVGLIGTTTRYQRFTVACVAAALIASSLVRTIRDARETPPWAWEEVKPNLSRLAQMREQQDVILVSPNAELALLLYARQYGFSGLRYRAMANVHLEPRCLLRDLASLPAGSHAWLLTAHDHSTEEVAIPLLLAEVSARGEISLVGDEKRSQLYRIALRPGTPAWPAAPNSCGAPRSNLQFRYHVARVEGLTPVTAAGLKEAP